MPTSVDLEFCRRYRERVESPFGGELHQMRIFGSRARGDQREDSDLDLFVCVGSPSRDLRNALCDTAWDVAYEMELPYPVVVHVMTRERFDRLLALERRLATDIMTEGIAV